MLRFFPLDEVWWGGGWKAVPFFAITIPLPKILNFLKVTSIFKRYRFFL